MKLVVNKKYGGFGLSDEAVLLYCKLKGINVVSEYNNSCTLFYIDGIKDNDHFFYYDDINRSDPILIQVVEELGEKVNDRFSCLKIIEIPDDIEYYISDYDGIETVREKHNSW
jgi:hypothetical protein